MRLKPIATACLAMSVATGCGSDNQSSQNGQTVTTSGQIAAAYLLACVDVNQNGQCDDGDIVRTVSAVGDTQLTPNAAQYVLLEGRDTNNQRTSLLISEKGSPVVNGLSTLRATLNLPAGSAMEQTLASQQNGQLAEALQAGYAAAMKNHPVALSALASFSAAVQAQKSATPSAVPVTAAIGAASAVADWASTDAKAENQQLSVYSSTVLGNNESNRLYLFDASAGVAATREIDLIPAPDQLARLRTFSNPVLAALDKFTSVFIDTASAASSVTGTPSTGTPVVLAPGKGIAAMQMTRSGSEAIVLMNLKTGKYADNTCKSGSEGIYKIALNTPSDSRPLSQSPICAHSGFTLLASDPNGARIVAWDATAQKLWSIDGATMKERALLDLQITTPQAITVSPGGRFAAVAGNGQLEIIDLESNRVVTNLQGNWTNPGQIAFAGGVRNLLVTSADSVVSLTLDNAMQLLATNTTAFGQTVKSLAVAEDGDSYVAAGDAGASWRALQGNKELANVTLPSGLDVKRIALTDKQLLVLGLNAAQARYRMLRMPVSLAAIPR